MLGICLAALLLLVFLIYPCVLSFHACPGDGCSVCLLLSEFRGLFVALFCLSYLFPVCRAAGPRTPPPIPTGFSVGTLVLQRVKLSD